MSYLERAAASRRVEEFRNGTEAVIRCFGRGGAEMPKVRKRVADEGIV